MTGRRLGPFKILRKLGAGGMAVVYKAHEGSLNRVVALKVIGTHLSENPRFVERFRREAQAAARLNHPNIVQIYSIGHDEGIDYFAMEYVQGRSVQQLIEQDGFLTPARAIPIVRQVAEALVAAHAANIVHRDIKPANILVDSVGRAKVADFGIAHLAGAGSRLTGTGLFVGSREYVSPEQCHGDEIDGRADIYSLGVTLYEMLTGRTPFDTETPASLVLQIVEGRARPIEAINPAVPEPMRRLVATMMHRDRDQRFHSAEDLVAALREIEKDAAVSLPAGLVAPAPAAASEDITARSTPTAPPIADETVAASASAASGMGAERPTAAAAWGAPAAGSGAVARQSAASDADGSRPGPADASASAPPRNGGRYRAVAAAAVLLLLAIATIAAWRLGGAVPSVGTGEQGAGNDTEPLRAVSETQPLPPLPREDADASRSAVTNAADEGAEAADPDTGGGSESGARSADVPATNPDATAVAEAGATSGSTGSDATPVQQSVSGSTPVSEPDPDLPGAPLAAAEQPVQGQTGAAVSEPSTESVAVTIEGDYEYIDIVISWIEAELRNAGFDVIDVSAAGRTLDESTEYHISATARLLGSEVLRYFGEATTQYTVALTLRAVAVADSRTAAGPLTETVKYTPLNVEQRLEEATRRLARRLARELSS